jgi:hypothetical protein
MAPTPRSPNGTGAWLGIAERLAQVIPDPDPSAPRRLIARAAELGNSWPQLPAPRQRALLAALVERIDIGTHQIDIHLRARGPGCAIGGPERAVPKFADLYGSFSVKWLFGLLPVFCSERKGRFSSRRPLQCATASAAEFASDSSLEEAVSSEPVSGNPKFPASWENTGKFIDFGL